MYGMLGAILGFSDDSVVKNSHVKQKIPGSGKSPGEGNGNLLQYSCLGNPMDRGAWRATICGPGTFHALFNFYHKPVR